MGGILIRGGKMVRDIGDFGIRFGLMCISVALLVWIISIAVSAAMPKYEIMNDGRVFNKYTGEILDYD